MRSNLAFTKGIPQTFTAWQQFSLITLRTLIGWHFLYEGYYKVALPGWSADGKPLAPWTSTGYLKAATGPFASLAGWLVSSGSVKWIDPAIKIALIAVGLSLMLGIATRIGCILALALLAMFYLAAIPLSGSQVPGSEGAYLIVNKTLIEAAAVFVLLAFNTGEIAGLDRLFARRTRPSVKEAVQVPR